ncbi:MAG: response regulator transcription factor [Candidatus Promineifilaceae bacterium]|nr:response regulator transcription factor [Candidatus Promineifilaceae bacterium]
MRVLLADDHLPVRSALKLALSQLPEFEIVGEAADATSLLRAAAHKEPDLLLLDWELPGLPMEQLLRLLRFERPSLKIFALSSRPEAEQAALVAGVHIFRSKTDQPERILNTLRSLQAQR